MLLLPAPLPPVAVRTCGGIRRVPGATVVTVVPSRCRAAAAMTACRAAAEMVGDVGPPDVEAVGEINVSASIAVGSLRPFTKSERVGCS